MNPDLEAHVVVVGGGVVGLACAAALQERLGGEVVVLEQHDRVCQETSARNSGVIHAGLYYEPGSLKATLCVEGARRLRDFCAREAVPHEICGKVVVAATQAELGALEALARNASQLGAEVELIDRAELRRREPAVAGQAAIWSPDTGILDVWELAQRLKAKFLAGGGLLVLQARVAALQRSGLAEVVRPDGSVETVRAQVFVNAAGLLADELAGSWFGPGAAPTQYYWKGSYFSVAHRVAGRLRGLVYPLPRGMSGGLGVHFTQDLAGGCRLGPDAEPVARRYPPDYGVDSGKLEAFWEAGRRLVPDLRREDLAPDTAGVRPRLYGPGEPVRDFCILEDPGTGRAAAVHLLGIESPGLTACLALASRVTATVAGWLT